MVYVYILSSETSGRFYVGASDDPQRRLEEHNAGKSVSTRNRGPWKVVRIESYESRSEALARERAIKSWKSAVAIRALIGP